MLINIKNLDLQRFLFEDPISRVDLLKYKQKSNNEFKISIYRNHSFELIEHTIHAYLDFAEIKAKFSYSDYDDSLSFFDLDKSSDLFILWLDLGRYNDVNINDFITKRLKFLKTIYQKPIIFIPLDGNFEMQDAQITIYNLNALKEKLLDKFLDLRLEQFSGTKLSHHSCLEISKDLGLNYIPSIVKPNLKAIIVDLDNTLYKGVLGEDGISGVVLSEAHHGLQIKLKELVEKGFLLCIASKNDERDVLQLFKDRKDFPLKLEDFTKICASWNSKADSIAEIASSLNIGIDSMLFIDDNMGEIASVVERHPKINLILAKDDAKITLSVLSNYPGLLKLKVQKEDAIRKADLIANQSRQNLQSELSKEDFIKSLEVEITFDFNNPNHIARISELSNKTNQFIFAYKRYSIAEVEGLMKNPNAKVVTISLKDKFSDSGIIGVCVIIKNATEGSLDEFFVSCRALGRGMDEIIVLGSIKEALKELKADKLKVNFIKGERNLPAENFINKFLLEFTDKSSELKYEIQQNLVNLTIRK